MNKKKLSELSVVTELLDTGNIIVKAMSGASQINIGKLAQTMKNKGYYNTAALTTDVNLLTDALEITVAGSSNLPVTSSGVVIVRVFKGGSNVRILQEFYPDAGTEKYFRLKIGTADWTAWTQ